MTNSDQQQAQDALALLTACVIQLNARGLSSPVRAVFLSEALCAMDTLEALTDPTRDSFAPTSFPPRASPDMRLDRLLLAQSLLMGHRRSSHLKVAA